MDSEREGRGGQLNDLLFGRVLKSIHLSTGLCSNTAFGCLVRTDIR